MSLRKAAEQALEVLETYWLGENAGKDGFNAIQSLRQALALEKFSEVNQELEEAIKKGTKAWAGVPNATEWVDELRGEPEQWKSCRHCGFDYKPPKADKWFPLEQPEWIDDDFGTMWQKCGKKDCGKFVVRIGKVDCWNGDCPERKELK